MSHRHFAGLLGGLLVLGACDAAPVEAAAQTPVASAAVAPTEEAPMSEAHIWMTAGGQRFAITLADTDAARAFAARLPLSMDMTDLHGNEKYADLPERLPTDAQRPGTIHNGDLMLFGSTTVVVFYKRFDTSYSYTRLGRVDEPADLAKALGRRGVHIEFSRD